MELYRSCGWSIVLSFSLQSCGGPYIIVNNQGVLAPGNHQELPIGIGFGKCPAQVVGALAMRAWDNGALVLVESEGRGAPKIPRGPLWFGLRDDLERADG